MREYRDDQITPYLSDESGRNGTAEVVFCPENEDEVCQAVRQAAGSPITIQGGHSGLWGAAVPQGGVVIQLGRMNQIMQAGRDDRGAWIRVQAGATLDEVQTVLEQKVIPPNSSADLSALSDAPAWWVPAFPLEATASVGGAVASHAAAFSRCGYGTLDDAVLAVRAVNKDGEIVAHCGPACADEIVTETTLLVQPKPSVQWAVVFFCPGDDAALALARHMAQQCQNSAVHVAACEWIGREMLDQFRENPAGLPALDQCRRLPDEARSMIYLELHGDDRMAVQQALMQALQLFMQHGGREPDTWAEWNSVQIARLRALCHAAMEMENALFGPRQRLRMDVEGAPEQLSRWIEGLRERAAAASQTITLFGHAADGHLHFACYPSGDRIDTARTFLLEQCKILAHQGAMPSPFFGTGPDKEPFWRVMMENR